MDQTNFASHEKWKKEEFVLYGQDMPEKYAYYRRSFGSYSAHIFLIKVSGGEQLSRCWESIDNQIAFYIQQDTEAMIEKSNFYVCYFAGQKVPEPLKRKIETDEFCSKKYVYAPYNIEGTDEEYCDYVEQNLFFINIDEKEAADPAPEEKLKIKEIEVENFRVFAGKKNISFACESDPDKAADLVVIYGPNGTGKTSLLDSVEYTMTGRVGRLDQSLTTQKDIKNYPEPVYHNRGKKDRDAYTKFITEQGHEVSRKVSKYDPSGSDLKRNGNLNRVSREILGNKQEDQEKWETFLLTHEVLDVFLSGTDPEEKYRLWVSKNSLLTREDKAFTEALEAYRKANSALNKIIGEANQAKEALKKLTEQKDTLLNVRGLIAAYNQCAQEQLNVDLFPDGHQLSVEEYDWFMTRIRGRKQEISQNIRSLKEQTEVLTKMQEIGYETIVDRFGALKILETCCIDQEKLVKNTKQCESIKQQKEKQTLALEKLMGQQAQYGQLLEKWDQVIDMHAKQENLAKHEKEYQKEFESIRLQTDHIRKYLADLQESKKNLDEINATEESAVKSLKKIEKTSVQLKELNDRLDKCKGSLKKAQMRRNQLRAELNRYLVVKLPEYLAEDTDEKISAVSEIISVGMERKLYQICLDYAKTKGEVNALNKAADTHKKIVQKLQKDAQEFLKIYQESTKCPLCGHDYGSADALASRFTMALLEDSNADEVQKEKLAAKIKQLEEQYEDWKNKADAMLSSKTEILKEQYKLAEKQYEAIVEEKKSLEDEKSTCNMEIAVEEEKLHSYGISETVSQESVESFYHRVKESLNEYGKKISDCLEKAAEYESQKEELEVQIRQNRQEQEAICASPDYIFAELCRNYKFDREKVQLHKEELDRKIEKDKEKLKETESELEKLKAYYFVQIEPELALLENYRHKLLAMKQENKPFLAYKDYSAKDLEELMRRLCGQLQIAHKQSEILKDILNENQLRDYFVGYSGQVKKVQKLENEQKQLEAKYQEKETEYVSRREELCRGLQNLHNQKLAIAIFNKINPNLSMDGFDYELSFTDADVPKPRLEVWVQDENKNKYKPEYYFSTAQLNTIVFSIYLARALKTDNMPLKTILVDDPVGHFDDINILSFADFLRILITEFKCQIVLTTFDLKVYRILERKLDPEHYSSRFIDLDREINGN